MAKQVREELHRAVVVARTFCVDECVDALPRLMFPVRQIGQVSLTGGPLLALPLRTLAILTLSSDLTSFRRDRLRTSSQFAGRARRQAGRRTWGVPPKPAHELRAHASIAASNPREQCDVLGRVEPFQPALPRAEPTMTRRPRRAFCGHGKEIAIESDDVGEALERG